MVHCMKQHTYISETVFFHSIGQFLSLLLIGWENAHNLQKKRKEIEKLLQSLLFQIILGRENSEPHITQLLVQFTQVLSGTLLQYFGLLIGNSIAYFRLSCAYHN